MTDYQITVRYDPRTREYVAEAPALADCRARGATPSEARRIGEQAVIAWLETAAVLGIPAPRAQRTARFSA